MNQIEVITIVNNKEKLMTESDFLDHNIINAIYDDVIVRYVSELSFKVRKVSKAQKNMIHKTIKSYNDFLTKCYTIVDGKLDIDFNEEEILDDYVSLREEKYNRKEYELLIQMKNIHHDDVDYYLFEYNYDLLMTNFLCNRKNPLCHDIIINRTDKDLINYEVRKVFYRNKNNINNNMFSHDISLALSIPEKYKLVCFFPIFTEDEYKFPCLFKVSQFSTLVIDNSINLTNSSYNNIKFKLGIIVLSINMKFIILPNYDLVLVNGNYIHKESSVETFISKEECYNIPSEIYYCF